MKLRIIIIVYLFFALNSCDKNDISSSLEFSGVIINLKDNKPMPNVHTKIHVNNDDSSTSDSFEYFEDFTYTDSNGLYYFRIDQKGIKKYLIQSFKENYIQDKILLNNAYYGGLLIVNEHSMNFDTIFMGQESILNIGLNILNDQNMYVVYCGEEEPLEFINDINNLQFNYLSIDTNNIENYKDGIINRYLFENSDKIHVAWYKNDSLDNAFLMDSFISNLIPMDTCFINLDLE